MADTREAIEAFVASHLDERLAQLGLERSDIDDFEHVNLIGAGIVDSLGFTELVAAVEDHFGMDIDFAGRDPSSFTTVSGFVTCVAESAE